MKTTKKQILEELGKLLYFAYEGSDGSLAVPSKKSFVDILEGLGSLSVIIKYLKFDIEALRREVRDLTNTLEKNK